MRALACCWSRATTTPAAIGPSPGQLLTADDARDLHDEALAYLLDIADGWTCRDEDERKCAWAALGVLEDANDNATPGRWVVTFDAEDYSDRRTLMAAIDKHMAGLWVKGAV